MTKFILLLFLSAYLLIFSTPLYSQGLPNTDIYLATISSENGLVSIGALKNITHRDGYDNQPSFLADGKSILYTSIRADSQADIYQYEIDRDTSLQITATKESEYSPTQMPDSEHFSVVRVEKDSTQRLWKFDLDGSNPQLVLKTIKPVGYQCWVDSQHVALFVLGNPNFLMLVDTKTEKAGTIANNIGRTLRMIPGVNAFSFVYKQDDTTWYVSMYDMETKQMSLLAPTVKGSEDFAWLPDGTILMSSGSAIYKFYHGTDSNWQLVKIGRAHV